MENESVREKDWHGRPRSGWMCDVMFDFQESLAMFVCIRDDREIPWIVSGGMYGLQPVAPAWLGLACRPVITCHKLFSRIFRWNIAPPCISPVAVMIKE